MPDSPLSRLRKLMSEAHVEAFVVPSEDQHFSEYLAECDKRRAFISGFTGSAGCAVITPKKAFLFTDGRYFLQAEKELDKKEWTLMKQGLPDVPTWQDFLHKNVDPGTKIGVDPTILTASDAEKIEKQLKTTAGKGKHASELIYLDKNLVDAVWDSRPPRPANPVFVLDEKYSGKSFKDKLRDVRREMEKRSKNTDKIKATVVSMLDEIAWLFNLRGTDIEFNPVFFANAVVTGDSAVLFVDEAQLTPEAKTYLGQDVQIRPYDDFYSYLKTLPGQLGIKAAVGDEPTDTEGKILLSDRANLAAALALGKSTYKIDKSIVTDLKAIKNPTELEGFRQSHIRDGAALVRYFAWLEEQLVEKNRQDITEYGGSEQLEKFRSEMDLFRGLSFTTISGTGPNGAIIHYDPDPKDSDIIKKDQVYLCDSGGQYLDGTTDVTRTLHFGTPTAEEKRAFTRVLQGHISIDTAIFPHNTTGFHLDSFARRALWQDGLDYRHGTGHGIGHFLNVHEGPHGIGQRIAYNSSPLKPGMIISNEPGYYKADAFGIRIESVVFVKPVKTSGEFGVPGKGNEVKDKEKEEEEEYKGWLGLERVTMAPIQTKLIDQSLLTADEKTWVNEYHAEVLQKVGPLLVERDPKAYEWLKRECEAI